ncbi:MAG: 23S rRNA (pseudouridine(1915)-N(3))-methyltransferase RlmH [Bacteroidales bacterium]
MKITFLFTGKTKIDYIEKGVEDYFRRIRHYIKTEIKIIPDLKNTKNMSEIEQMQKEGEAILKELPSDAILIIFDEKGKKFTSTGFSAFLQKKMLEGKDLVMVIGGAYGFSDAVKKAAEFKISLSDLTFSHQMVRIILLEQAYRAFTIMRGEPYHHA